MADTDILEIKRRLATAAESVGRMLLPNAVKIRNELRCGSVNGEKGESLGIHLDPPKAGVWSDFSAGGGGDLLDLWMAVKGLTLPQALDEACKFLGIERQKPYREPQRQYVRPPKPRCTVPQRRVRDYLTQDRGLPFEVIQRYRVGEDGEKIIFPFLSPSDELIMVKGRTAAPKANCIPLTSDFEPILFGWQAMPKNAREVVLTEGEIDALTMAAYGFPAMSLPLGGGGKGKQNWIENEFDRMQQFEKIYIATDMDKPGEDAAKEIVSRLGRHRCYRVVLPFKDANNCWLNNVTKEQMAALVAGAQSMDPEGLRRPMEFYDRVCEMFYPSQETKLGYTLPFAGLNGNITFGPGELTVWGGAAGSGKTTFLCSVTPFWIEQGSRICIASFEMKCEQTLKKISKQTGGVDRPTQRYLRDILQFLDAGLMLYDQVGKASLETVLDIFDYAHAKYGCDQFVIDSLMRLGIEADDYNGQEKAIFRLVDWTVQRNVHLHLVAHSRKSDKNQGVPETEDLKGAMEIGANAFNVLLVWRNRKAEDRAGAPDTRPDILEEPTVTVNVAKQRNGDFEGKCNFYFNRRTYQYFSERDDHRLPRCYVAGPAGLELVR